MCAFYKGIEIPENDAERVEALKSYGILDTAPEQDFDDITEIAANLTGCKVSYIGFFDDERLWLKSKYGLPPDLTQRPRELTLCSPTICQSELVVVPDMSKVARYADLPTVKEPPHARFYCAMPLINPEGYALGTLCVWDTRVMHLEPRIQQCMRRLARQVMGKLELRREIIEAQRQRDGALAAIEAERTRAIRNADLVRGLFPSSVAERVLDGVPVAPRYYASATVMFIDFADFTRLTESVEPRALIEQLGDFFAAFDRIVEKHGLEKIKTIGDGYLAVCGLPIERPDHAHRASRAALEIRDLMKKRNTEREKLLLSPWPVRVGIHSGSVIAGVVGASKLTFDVWGDGVNLAARLQQHSEAGEIAISEGTVGLLDSTFEFEELGEVEAKNKGKIRTYRLLSSKVPTAAS